MTVDLNLLEDVAKGIARDGWWAMADLVRAAIAGLSELRARPAPHRWTREKPAGPGWYWMRGSEWPPSWDDPMIVAAMWRGGELIVGGGYERAPDVEFAGPIPEPAEPEEASHA